MRDAVKQFLGKRRWILVGVAVVAVVGVVVLVASATADEGNEKDRDRAASTESSTSSGGPGDTPDDDSPTTSVTPNDDTSTSTGPGLSTEPQTEIPRTKLAPGGGPKAATNLSARSECEPQRGVSAQFSWSVAAEPGTAQRVAITQYADGFETQRFSLSAVLPADATEYFWLGGLEPGILYRWEVLTRHGEVYTRSATATFRGADCLAGG